MQRWRIPLGVALVAVLVWHALQKPPELRAEMLWACHVANAILALGLFARSTPLVAGAFVYHAAVGLPSWLLDTIATRTTTFTSALAHLLPLVAGALTLRGVRWPRAAIGAAWASQIVLLVLSRALTPPALNVNLAFAPWEPMAGLLPSLWAAWAFHLAWTLGALLAGDAVLRRLMRTGDRYQRYMSPDH